MVEYRISKLVGVHMHEGNLVREYRDLVFDEVTYALYKRTAGSINTTTAGAYYLRCGNKKYAKAYFARVAINCPADMEVDHINGDTLDNRLCNLRVVTSQQNSANTKARYGSKGVKWRADRNKWQARHRGKSLGHFVTEAEAVAAYEQHVLATYGEYAAHVSRKPA